MFIALQRRNRLKVNLWCFSMCVRFIKCHPVRLSVRNSFVCYLCRWEYRTGSEPCCCRGTWTWRRAWPQRSRWVDHTWKIIIFYSCLMEVRTDGRQTDGSIKDKMQSNSRGSRLGRLFYIYFFIENSIK